MSIHSSALFILLLCSLIAGMWWMIPFFTLGGKGRRPKNQTVDGQIRLDFLSPTCVRIGAMKRPLINFRIEESSSQFLDPRKGFQPASVAFQVRFDPLTGRSGHFSHFGAVGSQPLDLDRYRADSGRGFCPFCPDHRDSATPRFSESLIAGGRIALGEALLVPNLFPYDVYSSVAIMTGDHVVSLDGFDSDRLKNAFTVGLTFLKRVAEVDESLPFHMMGWNYMPPSGGGLVHPHQQYFATSQPGNTFRDEFSAARDYYSTWGQNYWSVLADEEADRGERYVGTVGDSHWMVSFVSRGIAGDVLVVFPEAFSIDHIGGSELESLTSGLLRLFAYFRDAGIFSFNALWCFGPKGQEFFPSHLRIVPRTFLNTRDFASDASFLHTLLEEPVGAVLPEELCVSVKAYFEGLS
jgi:UDPglucose--hexose-1-phosphate uridylyltransferase